jgi:hypothetical protein
LTGTLQGRLRVLHRSNMNAVNGKGTSFGGPQMRHELLKFEIMIFFLIKKRHPTKMKYGTYRFY